ncbi:MAG: DUF3104 domain-containing protein [Prochlorococcus sp.]|nr:DUF3104 domain-containing protein [Prochlorococcaceae cyanobacterium ETNP18_MAG_1]
MHWLARRFVVVFPIRPFSFLQVSCGELVIVFHNDTLNSHQDWWVGEVIHVVGSARGPEPSMFQIACIDTGIIRMVNADLVIDKIKPPAPQQKSKSPIQESLGNEPL